MRLAELAKITISKKHQTKKGEVNKSHKVAFALATLAKQFGNGVNIE